MKTNKVNGLELLQMIVNDELECGTMIRYKREDLMLLPYPLQPVYEYYKYTTGDKRFHRCDENGKLGATGQQRFMNYSTLNKTFEIVETIEDDNPLDDGYEPFKEEQDIEELTYGLSWDGSCPKGIEDTLRNFSRVIFMSKEKINELIKAVNKLKNKED